jgi:hypothetical protein
MVAMNAPDLTKDEEIMTRVDEAAERLAYAKNKA